MPRMPNTAAARVQSRPRSILRPRGLRVHQRPPSRHSAGFLTAARATHRSNARCELRQPVAIASRWSSNARALDNALCPWPLLRRSLSAAPLLWRVCIASSPLMAFNRAVELRGATRAAHHGRREKSNANKRSARNPKRQFGAKTGGHAQALTPLATVGQSGTSKTDRILRSRNMPASRSRHSPALILNARTCTRRACPIDRERTLEQARVGF